MKSSTIEFFARPVEQPLSFTQHLYIVSTDSQGHEKILRAGPETDKRTGMLTDDLKVIYTDYIKANKKLLGTDLDIDNRTTVYTITGTDSIKICSLTVLVWVRDIYHQYFCISQCTLL